MSLLWNVFTRGRRFEEVLAWPNKSKDAIERTFGFRPAVIVRTPAELKDLIASNPFAEPRGIEPNKLLVVFRVCRQNRPEELRMEGRELYMYFPRAWRARSSSRPPIVLRYYVHRCHSRGLRFEGVISRKARVVELRYFSGLTVAETAPRFYKFRRKQ